MAEIKKLGATHIWYTGLIEHATKSDYTQYGIEKDHPAVVKGMAGSPYAIKDYYDIDPDLATKVPERMKEFEKLVMRTHKADLKMIIDFVPNHVARQYHSDAKPEGVRDLGEDDDTTEAFHPDNNFYYMPCTQFSPNFSLHDEEMGDYVEMPAKVTGNDCFTPWVSQNDWYETVKLNYGVDYQGTRQLIFCPSTPNTWLKMRDILLFWASKGIDGFRCDMAEMVPCDFWGWVIPQVKAKYPDCLITFDNVERDVSLTGHIHPGQHVERGGLARPVRSDQSVQMPRIHRQLEAGDRLQSAEGDAEIRHFQKCHITHPPFPASPAQSSFRPPSPPSPPDPAPFPSR